MARVEAELGTGHQKHKTAWCCVIEGLLLTAAAQEKLDGVTSAALDYPVAQLSPLSTAAAAAAPAAQVCELARRLGVRRVLDQAERIRL